MLPLPPPSQRACSRCKPARISLEQWQRLPKELQLKVHRLGKDPQKQRAFIEKIKQGLRRRSATSEPPPSPSTSEPLPSPPIQPPPTQTTTTTTTVPLTGVLAGWRREDRITSNGRSYPTWFSPTGSRFKSYAGVMRSLSLPAAEDREGVDGVDGELVSAVSGVSGEA